MIQVSTSSKNHVMISNDNRHKITNGFLLKSNPS